jgi:DNA-binding NarL/FixJ family response regulator
MSRIRVLVVEDEAFTRSTLVAALEYEGFDAPGPSDGAATAVASFNRHHHDVLLADLDLGFGPSGLELAWLLRKARPDLGVVLLTSFQNPRLHRSAVEELPPGTRYLIKQDLADRSQISQALRFAIEDSKFGFMSTAANTGVKHLSLSTVQLETLRLVADGLSNAEIAKIRFVSEKAVEQTIQRLAKKFDVDLTRKNVRVELAQIHTRLTRGKS